LVTLLDVVSPSNKTSAAGREGYLSTRRQGRAAGASLVEVDLVLQGQPMLDYSRENLPKWDYAVTVVRATQPDRFEIYTATLQKRLPRFRLPLAATDQDTLVDLQTALARCYDRGGFAQRIDYRREPAAPLSADDRQWLDGLLRSQKLREEPAHGQIAVAAYYLWQQEGCPHGREQEHWHRAVKQLRRQSGVE
jgi:hypothetical protein